MRYTEIRMAPIAALMLTDIDRDTVDFADNYDGAEREPTVLPARLPNLLVNGASGIAVGMATNIPPHNLREIIDAALALSREPDIDIAGLMEHVPGPDFPTAAQIVGEAGMAAAYRTGRGTIQLRARADIEEGQARDSIVITELPYRVNKARCVEKIAMLARKKEIAGIQEVRDESDKDGTRVVVELRRDVSRRNRPQQSVPPHASGIELRDQHGGVVRRPPAVVEPQGDARSISSTTGATWSRAAASTICAGPRLVRMSWKA